MVTLIKLLIPFKCLPLLYLIVSFICGLKNDSVSKGNGTTHERDGIKKVVATLG